MPSAAAVFAFGSSDRTFIVCSASGSRRGLFGSDEQALGLTVDAPGVAAALALALAFGVASCAGTAGAVDGVTLTFASGTTLATAGSAASWSACAAVTVAANALPTVYFVTC